jgi:hypothetical protein
MIVPASMPLAGMSAVATAPSAAQAPVVTASAAGSGVVSTAGVAGAVPAIGAPAVAGASAAPPAAGQTATSPGFDPATFDEAHGRSRGTAPPGTPVEMGGMQCPNEVCKPLPALPAQAASAGVMVSLCCTPEGECGTKGSSPMSTGDPNLCRIIPDSDPQCARLELMGFEIASCCTADGKCGLNGQAFMMKPCGSIEEAMAMFGGFIELPPAAACAPGMGPPNSSSAPPPGAAPAAAGSSGSMQPTAAGATAPAPAGAPAVPTAGTGGP